jgi:hypothetical protein
MDWKSEKPGRGVVRTYYVDVASRSQRFAATICKTTSITQTVDRSTMRVNQNGMRSIVWNFGFLHLSVGATADATSSSAASHGAELRTSAAHRCRPVARKCRPGVGKGGLEVRT